MAGTPQYQIIVEGTYYAGTRNNKAHKPYKAEKFILPSLTNAQHTIYRKLITPRLASKYPDFVGVRTCQIVDQKTLTGAAVAVLDIPVSEMNLAQLTQFVVEKDLAVNPQNFGSVVAARKAVSDALDDRLLLQRQQNEENARKEKEKEDKEALDGLSRTADVTDEDASPVTEAAVAQEKDPLEDLE